MYLTLRSASTSSFAASHASGETPNRDSCTSHRAARSCETVTLKVQLILRRFTIHLATAVSSASNAQRQLPRVLVWPRCDKLRRRGKIRLGCWRNRQGDRVTNRSMHGTNGRSPGTDRVFAAGLAHELAQEPC